MQLHASLHVCECAGAHMCIRVCTCTHECEGVHVYMFVQLHSVYMFVSVQVHTCAYMYTFECTGARVYMFVQVHACVHVCECASAHVSFNFFPNVTGVSVHTLTEAWHGQCLWFQPSWRNSTVFYFVCP